MYWHGFTHKWAWSPKLFVCYIICANLIYNPAILEPPLLILPMCLLYINTNLSHEPDLAI